MKLLNWVLVSYFKNKKKISSWDLKTYKMVPSFAIKNGFLNYFTNAFVPLKDFNLN